jgi:hypothetical protein
VFRSPKYNNPDEKEIIDHLIVHISQKGGAGAKTGLAWYRLTES